MSYDDHKSSVSENQRYGGKDYVEKGYKGDDKQQKWLEKIHSAMKKASLSASGKQVWKMLENDGFENIPRTEKKFVNFVKKLAQYARHKWDLRSLGNLRCYL